MKKALLAILLVIIPLAGGVFWWSQSRQTVSTEKNPTETNPAGSVPTYRNLPLPESTGNGKIVFRDRNGRSIEMNDIITKYPEQNPQHDRYLSEKMEYNISYVNASRTFFIAFSVVPDDALRKKAEQDLLSVLGVDSESACRLNVHESVPQVFGDQYAGVNFGFSTCPGSSVIPQ